MAEFTSFNGYQVKDAVARSIAKGRNQAVAFVDYATMIETLNGMEKDEYRAGQNIYIGVVGVPDLWVYSVEDIVHNFEYVSDEEIVEMLKNNTTIQTGYFRLAMLEGQKVDLTTYDQKLIEHSNKIEDHDDKIEEHDEELKTVSDSLNPVIAFENRLRIAETTETINNVTFTVNVDGSVTVNGTATAITNFDLSERQIETLPTGEYVLSGLQDGSSDRYSICYLDHTTETAYYCYSGDTKIDVVNENERSIFIRVEEGATVSNVTFYPSIRQINENPSVSNFIKFQFATDGEGNYGYLGADDCFVPFKRCEIVTISKKVGGYIKEYTVQNDCKLLIILSAQQSVARSHKIYINEELVEKIAVVAYGIDHSKYYDVKIGDKIKIESESNSENLHCIFVEFK